MARIAELGTSHLPPAELKRRAARIRLLVCDCDGVLTDGGMYFTESGEAMKRFDTRDGQGIALLREAGVEVAFLTRERTNFAKARADKLGLAHCILGATDKAAALAGLQGALGVGPEATAYVGDDHHDKPCAPLVALFFTPCDGFLKRADGVHVVTSLGGGRGAVRQVSDFLRAARGTAPAGGRRTTPK